MVRKVENKTKISNYGTSWFNPQGQKGLICTHGVGTPLIIVDFDVVIIDTLVGFDVSHLQSVSHG